MLDLKISKTGLQLWITSALARCFFQLAPEVLFNGLMLGPNLVQFQLQIAVQILSLGDFALQIRLQILPFLPFAASDL